MDIIQTLSGFHTPYDSEQITATNKVDATAVTATVLNATVTVSAQRVDGNSFTLAIANGVGLNQPLAAVINETTLTINVALATNGAGAPDNAANTGTAVAAIIDGLAGFTAVTSGTGAGVVAAQSKSFSGGSYGYGFDTAKLSPFDGLGKARLIFVTVPGAVRYRIDGPGPVAATTGHLAAAASTLTFGNYQAAKNFRAVKEDTGGADVVLQVTYFR